MAEYEGNYCFNQNLADLILTKQRNFEEFQQSWDYQMFKLCLMDQKKYPAKLDAGYEQQVLEKIFQNYQEKPKEKKTLFKNKDHNSIDPSWFYGFHFRINAVYIDNSEDARMFVNDLRRILFEVYGNDAFCFQKDLFVLELTINLENQIFTQLSWAMITVILVVYFITFNMTATIFIIFVVMLVILYMAVSLYFWGLTQNSVTMVNFIFGMGISVDYSVHIAYKYLIIDSTEEQVTANEKRSYKAKKAIS